MNEVLLNTAKALAPSVFVELEKSEALLKAGFFTEAALRLGRATEAMLYAFAAEANLGLTDKSVTLIKNLRETLDKRELDILRSRGLDKVRKLSDVSKRLSETISLLTEDENLRGGELLDIPKRPEAIFREMLGHSDVEVATKKRLGPKESVLRDIFEKRNNAAHADINLGKREIAEDEVVIMRDDVCEFVDAMLNAIYGIRAEKRS